MMAFGGRALGRELGFDEVMKEPPVMGLMLLQEDDETRTHSLCMNTPRKRYVKIKPGKGPSPITHPFCHPELELPVPRTVRNNCLLVRPPSL